MRTYRQAGLLVIAVAGLAFTASDAGAQNMHRGGGNGPTFSRVPTRPMPPTTQPPRPTRPDRPDRPHRPGWGHVHPGIIVTIPPRGPYVYDPPVVREPVVRQSSRRPPPRRNTASGAPPGGERRFVPNEVIVGVANTASQQSIAALLRRNRVTEIERQPLQLSGTTMLRLRIPDRRSVASVVRALEAERMVAAAQPNYLFRLQQQDSPKDGAGASQDDDGADYAAAKLRVALAHSLANGENVLVAVIDSGIDASHPALAGAIADRFNALDTPEKPDAHGTGIAGIIAGHGRQPGVAPAARILAVRAFDGRDGTSFSIRKGLDWAVTSGARVINMSFAGPSDPGIARSLAAAGKKGIVLVAAAGNAGPKSPPLYPAADPNVIAVTATDADDKLYPQSNRGRHVAIAAPGVDIIAPGPDATYQVASGTSFAAAKISGVVALMVQGKPERSPREVRRALTASAKDLGPKGVDEQFGAGLADAYAAVSAGEPVAAARN